MVYGELILHYPMGISDDKFQQLIKALQNKTIDQKTLEEVNKPWSDPKTHLSEEDKVFLENLIKKIESKDIELLRPSSILNETVYSSLSGEKKALAEVFVNATLALIRQIYDFYQNPYDNESDMMIAMIHDLRTRTEQLEGDLGDVLKI